MIDAFRQIQRALDDQPHLHRLGALFSDTVLVKVDGEEVYLVFDKGHITDVIPGPSRKTPYRFGLITDAEALRAFWQPVPQAGFHDIFAMAKIGRAEIIGDMLALVRNLGFFKEVLALGRTPAPPARRAEAPLGIEPITGRYVTVDIAGRRQRIYFEEAGQGRPVLCLHTAGSDTRQWRHILNDAELSAGNRIIAFDMPWHGKSLPPEGFQTEEYLLTTEVYMQTVLAVAQALGLDRPVLAGVSMGGRIALQLALHHPEAFRGFLAIEASDFQPAWYDIDWFHRPDAHGGEMGAALVSTNITPHAPLAERWNTLWMFMQSGRGVFRGDLSFYTQDDSLVGQLGRIDTTKTPVHFIVGAYDFTCTPEDARRTADQVPGATLSVMPEVGHFPMSEHPEAFRAYFAEGLNRMPR